LFLLLSAFLFVFFVFFVANLFLVCAGSRFVATIDFIFAGRVRYNSSCPDAYIT